jgi:4-diphosphocytidyl-2-C-methyl-D-erythritol kinase
MSPTLQKITENSVRVLCPAKVNLCLHVLSKRDDGFHEILSLMQPISLYDELTVTLESDGREGINICTNSPDIPSGSDNIVHKAARLFMDECSVKAGISADISPSILINIVKNIPVSAGLGGGSSDAAGVLMALNKLFEAKLSEDELMGMASELGSDVPFFMLNSSAIARGRGEELEKVELPSYGYVLVNPPLGVSAKWAYENLDLTNRAEDNTLTYLVEALRDPMEAHSLLLNDLETAVFREYPEVQDIKSKLAEIAGESGLGVLMSGSGPTVFALFEDHASAFESYELLKNEFDEDKGFRVILARGL